MIIKKSGNKNDNISKISKWQDFKQICNWFSADI